MTIALTAERFAEGGAIPVARLRALLGRDPIAAAYQLGDLAPEYASHCSWWIASEGGPGGADVAVVLVYTGLSAPAVHTWGSPAGVQAILAAGIDELPQRAHLHMAPEHLAPIDLAFTLEHIRPMVRMGLELREATLPEEGPPLSGFSAVTRLGHRHTGDIMALFEFYPDNFFEPYQLSTGHYYGIFQEGEGSPGPLVCVAGVHVVSREDRLAALGNIVTHPDLRGRGLSTRATSHLCRALGAEGIELLALNVERRNGSALRVYEKLGFRAHCTYIGAFMTRTLDRQFVYEGL